jgi:hypothetical protein
MPTRVKLRVGDFGSGIASSARSVSRTAGGGAPWELRGNGISANWRFPFERLVRLPQWDAAIERKLRVLDGSYEKLSSRAASRRFEVLEVVIIVLIAVSSLTPFLPLVTE